MTDSVEANWMVLREDSNGICTILADRLSEAESRQLVCMFTQRGHKAVYFARIWLDRNQREQILETHHVQV